MKLSCKLSLVNSHATLLGLWVVQSSFNVFNTKSIFHRSISFNNVLMSLEKKVLERDQRMKELQVENSQKQFEMDRNKAKISQLQLEITTLSQEKTTLVSQLEESRRKYKQDISVFSSKEIQLKEVTAKIETYRFESLFYLNEFMVLDKGHLLFIQSYYRRKPKLKLTLL